MFNVTAKPPPLISLAVVVPGPASSNGNLNFNVWAETLPPDNNRLTRNVSIVVSWRMNLFRRD